MAPSVKSQIICERRKSGGYDLRMGNPVYAIDEFPDDDLPWRIEWAGGVGYNKSVASKPRIDVLPGAAPTAMHGEASCALP
jgi:hypothetical protein